MKYKKFALLALAAGMIVGCGEGPSAPDWSAEFKTFVSKNFYNLSVPYFGSAELGSFTYAVHEEGYAEIFGGELESTEPIKTAAKFLEEKGYVDLYGAYRNDPAYAQYASMFEWSYPMEYRFVAENVGPRYIRIGLSGKLPEPNKAEGTEEPAEPARSFYAQVFDPYYYSWFDSYSTDLISIAFGQKTGERSYEEDETIASELVPYLGQATYESSGNYISDLDDAIAEVAKNGYYKFWMNDVVREELDAYVTDLKDAEDAWDVYTYEEHELEPGYLGRLYKLVSPSKYFTIDVYFAEGEAMFRVAKAAASIPQVIKDMEPALFASNEVTAYDFKYFENEETGASGYSYSELSEEGLAPTGVSIASAVAAYNGLVDDENLGAVEIVEFGFLSAAEAQGVLDVKNHQVVVYADLEVSGIDWEAMAYTYYFFWGVEVSEWPTYPSELTAAFLTAAGATNIHQFFEQEDGSFKFGNEAESEAAVAAVFNAIKSLEGAEVLTDYANGIGRVKVSDTKMAVIELVSETVETEGQEPETSYGYYVTLTDIPNFPAQAIAIAEALGVSKFEFVEDAEIEGAWFIPANEEDTTLWADEKTNLGALLDALKTIPGIEFEDPQIQDENDEYWGSYYVAGLLDGKLVILQSVRVGMDKNYNGYYSAQIIVADPKEEDPAVSAFMKAVADFLGIQVEFNQITGAYTFEDGFPVTLTFDVNNMEATLREAFPDAEFTLEISADEYGDPVVTIVYSGYEIEIHVEDWTFDEEDPYYWIYAYCDFVQE